MKLANVIVQRLEEKPPGDGVPAGWLPEVVYHLKVDSIPYRLDKPEYTISLRPKGDFLLRKLSVAPECVDDWDLSIKIGRFTVLQRTGGRRFGEDPCWPSANEPMRVFNKQELFLTLFRRQLSVSKRFECILRGGEESAMPKDQEGRSLLP